MTQWLLAIVVSLVLIGIAYQMVGTEEPDFVITPPQKSTEHNATVERFEFDVKANRDLGDGFFNYTLVDGDDVQVTQGSVAITNQSEDETLDFDIDVEFSGERPRELVFNIQVSYGENVQSPEHHYKKEINKDRYYKVVTTE